MMEFSFSNAEAPDCLDNYTSSTFMYSIFNIRWLWFPMFLKLCFDSWVKLLVSWLLALIKQDGIWGLCLAFTQLHFSLLFYFSLHFLFTSFPLSLPIFTPFSSFLQDIFLLPLCFFLSSQVAAYQSWLALSFEPFVCQSKYKSMLSFFKLYDCSLNEQGVFFDWRMFIVRNFQNCGVKTQLMIEQT